MTVRQQVNLYQPILRKQPELLPLSRISLLLAAVVGSMLLISLFGWWNVASQRAELQTLQQEQQKNMQLVNEFASKAGVQSSKANRLRKEITQLQKALKGKQLLLTQLSPEMLGNTQGFSNHLQALAAQQFEGLWLTQIAISAAGDNVLFSGEALAPDLVPRFLTGLNQETAFQGTHFKALQINRPVDKPNIVAFTLTTQVESPGELGDTEQLPIAVEQAALALQEGDNE